MRKPKDIAAAAAFVLVASGAMASGEQPGVLTYQSSYFADGRPNTAYDMIGRLPGFTFSDGTTARGFAGTAGNVLIDGQRPTSKTDDLQSVLLRIPAADVDYVEVIRGGAPGIDMQGQTVIANIIRKKAESTQIVAQLDETVFQDGYAIPDGSLTFTHHSGDSLYEASVTRYGNYDYTIGNGFYNITDLGTGAVQHFDAHTSGSGTGGAATGAVTTPLFGGEFKANLALQDQPFRSENLYVIPGAPADDQLIHDVEGARNAELGLHWNGKIGDTQLETLALQRLGVATDVNTFDAPGNDQFFTSHQNTGESIARATLRYAPIENLSLEGGAEGAFNFLDGTSLYAVNSVNVPLPSANARVEERRGEVFLQGTYKFSDAWTLEAGARAEYSTISETGDNDLSRSFFYPKPRAVLTWTPDGDTQARFRYEKVVGQLDFNNFIATSSLAQSGVTAGNPQLKPDQHTQYELSVERHFWDKGAIVATLLHEQIQDVVDFVPVTGSSGIFDAPGNIGSGRNDQIDLEITLPLDRLGLTNGLIKSSSIFRFSQVRDPVTGELRTISGEHPQDVGVTLTQDIESLKSTWSVAFFNGYDEYYYRLTEERHRRIIPPQIPIYWEYKPTPEWSLHLEFDDIGQFIYNDKYYEYPGPRNLTAPDETDELWIRSQAKVYFQIRKTFS